MATSSAIELTKPPRRPDFGKSGRVIKVYANHYPIKFQNDESIVQYDIRTDPEFKIKEELRGIFSLLLASNPQTFRRAALAFDSVRNIYSNKKLSGITAAGKMFVIDREMRSGTMQSIKVTLKEVQLIQLADLNRALQGHSDVPYQALQAVDVILRWSLTKRFTIVYRSFYPEPDADDYLSLRGGHESWRGFYQSARPSQTGLSLNIDTAHTAFYEELKVDDFLVQYFHEELTSLNDHQRRKLASELKGVRVVNLHGERPRKYRITDISSKKPSQITFDYQGKTVNVTQYLKMIYLYDIQYPKLPCLKLNNKDIFLPMEVCKIVPGQYYKKKINERETANMVKFAAIPADQRRDKIDHFVKLANYPKDEVARGFNIQVGGHMKKVEARVLAPVDVFYRNDKKTTPRDGSWNLQNIQFVKSKTVKCWGCVWHRDKECNININKVEKLLMDLKISTEECGIQGISERNLIDRPCSINRVQDFGPIVRRWKHESEGKLEFVLCIIPGNIPDYYDCIKTIADLDYQLPTQCIQTKNVGRANRQFLANVALKINAKLGGTNNKINRSPILDKPTIVFGADVTHPGIGDQTSPSIAAIVGSAGIDLSHYFHAIRIQDHRQEIIADLENVVQQMLRLFHRRTRCKPEQIIFYRDGVSEGQFNAVIRQELTAIEKACTGLDSTYRPKITFLVVQKRHHTRFFPSRKQDAVGKARNVPPGLVVDTSVCHPSEFDFYLCSHFGIQGTSRPTHYHILLDENEISPDDLQQFTYQLCHVYCRCTRSVSIPAPVYYSHHLAFRARSYLTQLNREASPKEINAKINEALANNLNASVFFA